MGASACLPRTWTATATWTSQRLAMTTKSPGTRTTAARTSPQHVDQHRRRLVPTACLRRTWTATATPTCSALPTFDDKIAWYENDGSPGELHRCTPSARRRWGPLACLRQTSTATVTLDVLSRLPTADDTIAWYENDGSANFTTQTRSAPTANVNQKRVRSGRGWRWRHSMCLARH